MRERDRVVSGTWTAREPSSDAGERPIARGASISSHWPESKMIHSTGLDEAGAGGRGAAPTAVGFGRPPERARVGGAAPTAVGSGRPVFRSAGFGGGAGARLGIAEGNGAR